MDSIPAISAFTGIDYLPSFHGKDKIWSTNLWLYTNKIIDVFKYFEETETIALKIPVMPELACNMYGYKNKNYPQSIGFEFWGKNVEGLICIPKYLVMRQFVYKNSYQHINESCLEARIIKTFCCEDIFDSILQNLAVL